MTHADPECGIQLVRLASSCRFEAFLRLGEIFQSVVTITGIQLGIGQERALRKPAQQFVEGFRGRIELLGLILGGSSPEQSFRGPGMVGGRHLLIVLRRFIILPHGFESPGQMELGLDLLGLVGFEVEHDLERLRSAGGVLQVETGLTQILPAPDCQFMIRIVFDEAFQLNTGRLGVIEKVAALTQAAKERGLTLSIDVLPWLINHFYRDMPSLMALLDALDAHSLETKRAITLPLVRELLQIAGKKP